MGTSRRRAKPVSKKRKSRKDIVRAPKKNKPLGKDNEAQRHQLLEMMLPDVKYVPSSVDRLGRPPYYIVMRIYAGMEQSDTLDIRSDDAGVLKCLSDYAEGHGVWVEASTVKDPDLSDCHRVWVVDDPSQHRPFPAMLPLLFRKFIERILGYERVYAGSSLWMFERIIAFNRSKKK